MIATDAPPVPAVLAALALPPVVADHIEWWVAGAIIVLGLLVYGFRDLSVFSPMRAWAIGSVCFAESIRKRVLWITPLAILGIILVNQFQRPIDEADAVRQMLKVCLFATGVVVVITAVILACTNLPKEIENRVIFTVVTKPATRLEIVVGKVLGFARVSAAILLIMGLFTLGYLSLHSVRLQRDIAARLQDPTIDPAIRPTLEYYRQTGLLTARRLASPFHTHIVARDPGPGGENGMWVLGTEGDVLVPFELSEADLVPPGGSPAKPLETGLLVRLAIGYDPVHLLAEQARQRQEQQAAETSRLPPTVANPDAAGPDGSADTVQATVTVSIVDAFENQVVPALVFDRNRDTFLPDRAGQTPLVLYADPAALPAAERFRRIYVAVSGGTPLVQYRFGPESVQLLLPPLDPNGQPRVLKPAGPPDEWRFRGRMGRMGFQVRGGDPATDPAHVAVFRFSGATVSGDLPGGMAPFEFRADIERSGVDDRDEAPTELSVSVRNHTTGALSEPVRVLLEANRPIFFKLPAAALQGGEFDVLARCLTNGHYLGITRGSLLLVRSNQGFVLNLFKSLLIMWLMSVLVITVAIFCSTFLSWPIAIVLTLVMLLGHWGVMQLGDALQPGIGNMVATDLGFRDPAASAAVSKSVEALARFLNVSAAVLPDIGRFASIEDLERGVAVPMEKIRDPILVLLTFGLPIIVLSYIFLRNKEVAP